MFLSIILTAFRYHRRNLSYSFTTIFGLVVGLAVAILTFLWVSYEVGYNRYHPSNNRVYALLANEQAEGEIVTGDEIPIPLDFLVNEIPEVESATRIDNTLFKLSLGEKALEKRGVLADSSFFQVHFSEFIGGNILKPFPDNNSIAISETLADLLFEKGDALGKIILINENKEFKVTVVYSPYPKNSDLHNIDFVVPFNVKERSADDVWHNIHLKLHPGSSLQMVEQKISDKLTEILGDEANMSALLFCMTDWRLYWNFENGKQSGGRIVYVITFALSGLFILIMACINHLNITTAHATKRSREIGIRKVNGATRLALIRQFMTENLLIISISTILALIIAYTLLPFVNQLTGTQLTLTLSEPILLTGLLCIVLFTSLLAGSYPSFVLASFRPTIVLKRNWNSILGEGSMRKILLIFQFALSMLMILCSLIIWQQTDYLLNKNLGYDKSHVVNVWIDGGSNPPLENVKSDLLAHTAVESVGFGGASPMEINGWAEVNRIESPLATPLMLYTAAIDKDFLETLKIELVQGRNFSPDIASDSTSFIINQKAAEILGFKNPVGQRIRSLAYGDQEGEIIGVIKDFHHNDIHEPINPVLLVYGKTEHLMNLFIRYRPDQLEATIQHLKDVHNKHFQDKVLYYSLLDHDYENQFYSESLLQKISLSFTIVSILIVFLGVFSLAVFNAERRTKEIGIRKVLGASVRQIIFMLNLDFLKTILISCLIAFPLAYYLMHEYLQAYPFKIVIPISDFLIVGGSMATLALLLTSYQSMKSASSNPIDSLKVD